MLVALNEDDRGQKHAIFVEGENARGNEREAGRQAAPHSTTFSYSDFRVHGTRPELLDRLHCSSSLMTLIKRTATLVPSHSRRDIPVSHRRWESFKDVVSIEEHRTSRSDEAAFFPNNVIPIFIYLLLTFTLFYNILLYMHISKNR